MNGRIILTLSLILINLLCGFAYEKNKKQINIKIGRRNLLSINGLIAFILIATLTVIAWNTIDIPDIEGYKLFYSGKNNNVEFGFIFLEKVGQYFDLSFETFRRIFIAVCFLLLWIAVNRLQLNKNIVFALYSIYPCTYDLIQLRNFLALTLVLLGISFLYKKNTLNKIKCILCIVIASTFHSLMLVYFVLVFAGRELIDSRIKKQMLGIIISTMFIFSILMSRSRAVQTIIGGYFYSFNSMKANTYLNTGMRYGFIIFWCMEIFYVLAAYINKNNCSSNNDEELCQRKELSFWIMITITMIGCPLCILNTNFYRIFRNISVLNYGQLQYSVTSKNNYINILGIVLFILGFALNAIYELNINPEEVLYPFLGIN